MLALDAITQLPYDGHEPLELFDVEHSTALSAKSFPLLGVDDSRGPIDIAHNWGRTRVATASRSTLEPIASWTAKVAICQSGQCKDHKNAIELAHHDGRLFGANF